MIPSKPTITDPPPSEPTLSYSKVPYDTGLRNWSQTRRILLRVPVLLGDLLMVALAYAAGWLLRFCYPPFVNAFPITKGVPSPFDYVDAAPIILFMWASAMHWQGGYRVIQMQALDDGIRIFRAAVMGCLLSMSAMFLYRDISYSRLVFGLIPKEQIHLGRTP